MFYSLLIISETTYITCSVTGDAWVNVIVACRPFLHNERLQFQLKQCASEWMRRKQGIIQDRFRMKLHRLSHCQDANTLIPAWFMGHIFMNDVISMPYWRTHWTHLRSAVVHQGALSKHIPNASVTCWKIISALGSFLSLRGHRLRGSEQVGVDWEISDRARRPRVWFELMNKDFSVFPDQ